MMSTSARFRATTLFSALFIVASLGVTGCGDSNPPGAGDATDGGAGRADAGKGKDAGTASPEDGLFLSIAGRARLNVRPKEEIPLTALLFRSEEGPVSGEELEFEFVGDDHQDAVLSEGVGLTNDEGFGTVTLTAPSKPAKFQVEVRHKGVAEPVYFSITVNPVVKTLSIIGANEINAFTRQRIVLNAKLVDSEQKAVPNEEIRFEIAGGGGDAKLSPEKDRSAVTGRVSTSLETGTVPFDYTIKVSTQDAPSVQVIVRVKERQGNASGCQSTADCSQGLICQNNSCVPQEDNKGCQGDGDCPAGFKCKAGPDKGVCEPEKQGAGCVYDTDCPKDEYCDTGTCRPIPADVSKEIPCDADDKCPKGFVCIQEKCVWDNRNSPDPTKPVFDPDAGFGGDPGDGGGNPVNPNDPDGGFGAGDAGGKPPCVLDKDCPNGNVCDTGKCVQPPPPEVPDISGLWNTYHEFDLRNALLGFPKLAGPLDFVDQVFKNGINLGKIPLIGGVLSGMINNFINQYIPPWVKKLVSGLNAIANILQAMRVEGEMVLQHENPRTIVTGSEIWKSIVMYWIEQCPLGRKDPNFPSCAEVDVVVQDIGLQVKEQNKIRGVISGHTVTFDERKVEWEVKKLIKYVIDMVVQAVAGYNTLEEAIVDLIDCDAIEQEINNIAQNFGFKGSIPVKAACEGAKRTIAQQVGQAIAGIGVSWSTLEFAGYATIIDDGAQPIPYGVELKDGKWNGKIKIISSGKLTGTWKAER
ncbi:MAG: hypothetical protein GMKNLPBB_00320 [Myxococcota bacterium]|nr:hypothetical protein [Myxococcota bacterium]